MNPLTVGFKMMVTYLQTLGQLSPLFPGVTSQLLTALNVISNIYVPVGALRCLVPQPVYTIFYAMMILPGIALIYALALIRYSNTLCWQPVGRTAQFTKEQLRRKQMALLTRGRQPWQIVVLCFSTIFYLLYTTLISQITAMNNCDIIDYDEGGVPLTLARLSTDYSIDCHSDAYALQKGMSIMFLFLYGLGIPSFLLLTGMFIRSARGDAVEASTFAFLFLGYKPQYKYWVRPSLCRCPCPCLRSCVRLCLCPCP